MTPCPTHTGCFNIWNKEECGDRKNMGIMYNHQQKRFQQSQEQIQKHPYKCASSKWGYQGIQIHTTIKANLFTFSSLTKTTWSIARSHTHELFSRNNNIKRRSLKATRESNFLKRIKQGGSDPRHDLFAGFLFLKLEKAMSLSFAIPNSFITHLNM